MNWMGTERAWAHRERRVALYVPVQVTPSLRNCWAVNLSQSGIGLIADRIAGEALPGEGEELRLRFTLPGRADAIQVGGQIQWQYETSAQLDGHNGMALGVRFVDVGGSGQVALAQYFQAYRSHVAVLDATAEDQAEMERFLAEQVELHFAESETERKEVLARGDIAALVICGRDGGAALERLERVRSGAPVGELGCAPANDLSPRVVFAAAGSPVRLVDAFNRGLVFGVVARPWTPEHLQEAVLRACSDHGLRTEQRRVALALERALGRERARQRGARRDLDSAVSPMVCESAQLAQVVGTAREVAPHKIGVLLLGETGTGKELLARLIHDASDRANAPFVIQDCGALTETLLESELFGHVKGAFTGAVTAHPGLFVMTDGGTVLLDEVENTSANLQAKLLRVIETGEVRPVGGARSRRVDVRVIASSNRDLRGLMNEGRFRPDLFFRLSTFPITIPPLRDRPDDIMPLAEHFRVAANATFHRRVVGFTDRARALLRQYYWPGNVRELRNVVERAVLLCPAGERIRPALCSEPIQNTTAGRLAATNGASGGSLRAQLDRVERELIASALARHQGVLRRAARELQTNPVTLGRKAKRHGLIP